MHYTGGCWTTRIEDDVQTRSTGVQEITTFYGLKSIRPNKLTFLVLVSIPLKKWRCGANFFIFFVFKRGQIAGYSYAYKYIFNGV